MASGVENVEELMANLNWREEQNKKKNQSVIQVNVNVSLPRKTRRANLYTFVFQSPKNVLRKNEYLNIPRRMFGKYFNVGRHTLLYRSKGTS